MTFEEAPSDLVAELVDLLGVVPFDRLIHPDRMLRTPTFGEASALVGSAEAAAHPADPEPSPEARADLSRMARLLVTADPARRRVAEPDGHGVVPLADRHTEHRR
ncbi:hypothetical protein ETAA1_55510 [Urbifossiella limnaea]|uniref:Uncharacterized protein n=1 Tax=Urbifossiella limnaea TaxID=2528023 RepID=A0A517Y1C8_9BACT|nr:hypothetical protein ETAA1_55510 [Urbifossiella limnaea]